MAQKTAQHRRASQKSNREQDRDREIEAPGLEYAEFEQVRRERLMFEAATWESALAARAAMPRWAAEHADPAIAAAVQAGLKGPAVVGAGGARSTVRSAKPATDSAAEVLAVTVTAKEDFVAGTLVLPISAEDARHVDPRSLALHRWNNRTKQYDLLPQSGFDVAGGYVHGLISGSGRYAALAIPTGREAERLFDAGGSAVATVARMLYHIIRRRFDATGSWSQLGPVNLSCCVLDLAIDPSNTDRIYAAASDGGVWRLDSVAAYPTRTWVPLTDRQPMLRVECLAVSPADSRVVYYVDSGGTLRRSADHGDSWTTPGSANIATARRLIAHPTDANTIYVATSSGFWSSIDGGATWRHNSGQATLRDGDMTDAAIDPADPSILYLGQRGVGLLKSDNGGSTWRTMLSWSRATSPAGTAIRVAVGRGGTDATRTVAVRFDQEVFVNRHGARDITVPGGGTWTSRGAVGGTGYGDWCHVIAVDPFNDDVILAGGQQLYRSSTRGQSWSLVIDYYRPHEDQHRIMFDPLHSGVVYAANDGGMFRSTDGGATWQVDADDVANRRDLTHGLVTAQFYTAAISGDHAMGNLYHQGIAAADSVRLGQWEGVEGHAWEFNNVYGDPTRGGTYYVFGGQLFRREFPAGSLTAISTFQPTAVAVDQAGSLLAAANDGTVRRTLDPTLSSPTWTTMPGLSTPGDNVAAIAFAPSAGERAYAATSGGRIFSCANAATPTAWTAKTPLPTGGMVALAVSVENPSVVFAATSSRVYRSVDDGGHWVDASGTGAAAIPAGSVLRSLVAGPGALYAAAATGVFTSANRGASWSDFSGGLPNVELKELLWTEDDLFAVTHGRGIWHHGRYEVFSFPPIEHDHDIWWLIELWRAIHGGDPSPDAIRRVIGRGWRPYQPREAAREIRLPG